MPDQDLETSFISFAATASFALPEPYGILLSGGLSFAQSMFGGSSEDAIGEAFKAAVKAVLDGVKQLLTLQDLNHDKDAINDAMDWLNETTTKISELTRAGVDPTSTMAETLPKLEGFITQGSSIRLALENLSSFLKVAVQKYNNRNKVAEIKTKLSGLDLYGMLLAVYVTELRLRLQYYSVVKKGDPGYDALIYDHYLDFRDQTNDLLARLSEIILLLAQEVQDLATPLYWPKMGGPPSDGDWGPPFAFDNMFTGEKVKLQGMPDDLAKVTAFNMMNDWIKQVDVMMSPSKKLITGYQAKLQDWSENLRPTRPPTAPTGDPTQKTGAVRAKYAMTFANSGGEGPMSAQSAEVKLNSKTSDSVHVPVDSMGLAQSRKLYRWLDGGPQEMIAIIPDNKTVSWPK